MCGSLVAFYKRFPTKIVAPRVSHGLVPTTVRHFLVRGLGGLSSSPVWVTDVSFRIAVQRERDGTRPPKVHVCMYDILRSICTHVYTEERKSDKYLNMRAHSFYLWGRERHQTNEQTALVNRSNGDRYLINELLEINS